MPLRFRRSVSLFPGVHLNLSKSGASVSFGIPGATLNLGPRGTMATFGLPGTGLSYRVPLKGDSNPSRRTSPSEPSGSSVPPEPASRPALPAAQPPRASPESGQPQSCEIGSAPVDRLTSGSLTDLKQLLVTARCRRLIVQGELQTAIYRRDCAHRTLFRGTHFPLNRLFRGRIPNLQSEREMAQAALEEKAEELAGCYTRLTFGLNNQLQFAWDLLGKAHDALRRSERIWDITSSVANDRVRTRSAADHSVERIPVSLSVLQANGDIIASRHNAIRLGNANGNALDFYPGICLVREVRGDFALVDMLDIDIQFEPSTFIETEQVPGDSKVIRYAWAKSNKDGTRDQRFAGNRQIPVALYGQLYIRSKTGINEAYLFSNPELAVAFADAFATFTQAQKDLGSAEATSELTRGDAENGLLPDDYSVAIPDPPNMSAYPIMVAGLSVAAVVVVIGAGVVLGSRGQELWQMPASREQAESYPPAMVRTKGAAVLALVTPAERPAADGPHPVPPAPQSTVPILTPSLSPTASATGTVRPTVAAKTTANIRRSADPSSPIVQTAHAGERFTVFDRVKGWIQVGGDKPIGWIAISLTVE
jgi:hypothetical protein